MVHDAPMTSMNALCLCHAGFGPTELLMVDFTTGIHLEDRQQMGKLLQVVRTGCCHMCHDGDPCGGCPGLCSYQRALVCACV